MEPRRATKEQVIRPQRSGGSSPSLNAAAVRLCWRAIDIPTAPARIMRTAQLSARPDFSAGASVQPRLPKAKQLTRSSQLPGPPHHLNPQGFQYRKSLLRPVSACNSLNSAFLLTSENRFGVSVESELWTEIR